MSATIDYCPDCGGIVGATKPTDAGPPCTCFGTPGAGADPSGTQVLDSPKTGKICCRCGKDLKGKKRLKDSLGYWCVECHRMDKKEKEEPGVKCPRCGRKVLPNTIGTYEGEKMCSRCKRELKEVKQAGSKKFRTVSDKHFERHERKTLYIIAGIVVFLGLLIVLNRLGFIGGR